jgi:hypothetical protein
LAPMELHGSVHRTAYSFARIGIPRSTRDFGKAKSPQTPAPEKFRSPSPSPAAQRI